MSVGICKLCNGNKKLIKAHIIPRSFTLQTKGDSKQLLEARRHDKMAVHFNQNGFWDDSILCGDCDNGFSVWDEYGFNVLGSPPDITALSKDQTAFILRGIDYKLLKLFILSLLWRASVTTHPFFVKIRLGVRENAIAQMLRNQNPGVNNDFPIVLVRLIVPEALRNSILAPRLQRTPEGILVNQLFLPSAKVMIKTSTGPFPNQLNDYVLRPCSPVSMLRMPLLPKEYATVRKAAEIFRDHRDGVHKRYD